MIFFAVIRRISILLLKIEYCALFILLGMVIAVAAMSLATKEDPIAEMRAKVPRDEPIITLTLAPNPNRA